VPGHDSKRRSPVNSAPVKSVPVKSVPGAPGYGRAAATPPKHHFRAGGRSLSVPDEPSRPSDKPRAAGRRAAPAPSKALVGRRIQQREATRARIISAARTVFASQKFHFSTVDDIAAGARVSRATFYNHFRGKEEVLGAIIMQEHLPSIDKYHEILDAGRVDLEFMTNWVMQVVKLYKRKRRWLFSFYVVCDIYDDMTSYFSDTRDEEIDILGRRFSAFNIPQDGSRAADRRRTRAHLMLYQIEQFALHVVLPGWRMDLEEGCAAVAEQFLAFVSEGEPQVVG